MWAALKPRPPFPIFRRLRDDSAPACAALLKRGMWSILTRRIRVPRRNIPPMSQAAWFWQKADECARMAKNASEPLRRGNFETRAKEWRDIAERIERSERARFGSDPN